MSPARVLGLLSLVALVSAAGYMGLAARAPWSFLLPFRGEKLLALIVVAVAVSTATVLFQTITFNRILTPSVMGFDALYVLIVTVAVYLFGGATVVGWPGITIFLISALAMISASLLLFGTLLVQVRADIVRMILTGIIFGLLFRSLTGFLARLIDPNEFAVLQVASYARFNTIETELLGIAAPVTLVAVALAWRMRRALDVVALGHDLAMDLGEEPRLRQFQALTIVAVLVAVSTAFVGPVAFLGLLVVSLARWALPSPCHAHLLTASALVSVIVLVGGQTVLERVMKSSTPLSVIVELLGGLVFLSLVLRGKAK
ncbi:iron chelate uptake ABC transporter family permease subunit [Chachezhania sediminis]|uniref:iron chelate uptake ABC transporter family permease subunit n=1 Tax=Chachezhania sediminis TaxID=2599291 RepID=UPI00131B477E|nr:iron chelate uptake ABC transporter family permease subunit [Chachezhania sediminis]